MHSLHRWRRFAIGLALALLAMPTAVAAQTDAQPRPHVSVRYVHPHKFSESRLDGAGRYDHDDYLEILRTYIVKRATPLLAPGQRLDIAITDIKLAGSYEPWRGPQWDRVRIMRNVYPPRIDLEFKLLGSNGRVLRKGTRTLRDLAYLSSHAAYPGNTDSLRYDKALLNDWLRRGPDKL